ncbi:MAG: DNA-3-methyladenine glycosylase family protein [SAR324 cluster bacterium]
MRTRGERPANERLRAAALSVLAGDTPGGAARGAGYPGVQSFRHECLLRLHATVESLGLWRGRGRYRIHYGGPFDLHQTLGYLGRDANNLAERVHGRRYQRWFPAAERLPRGASDIAAPLPRGTGNTAGCLREAPATPSGGAVWVELQLGERFCTVVAQPPRSAEGALDLHERLVRFLGLSQPLHAFYRAAGGHPVMGPLVRRFAGVRIPQLPTLWEALCWAVVGQQINLAFAYRLRNRLIAVSHGLAPDAVPDEPLAFPEPRQVLRLRAGDLQALQFSRQKTRYLLGLAQTCHAGDLAGLEPGAAGASRPICSGLAADLFRPRASARRLGGSAGSAVAPGGDPDWAAIEARLLKQPGVGPWSAAYAMMRGLGYMDGLPVGDTGLRTALQRSFGLKRPPTAKDQEELMEPFRPYRGLATYYLWKSLAKATTD